MKMAKVLMVAIVLAVACSSVRGDYTVSDQGEWPDTWPKELEPLRKQARTLEGPLILLRHYQIPFTKREDFEAAWPHFLKVKSKGAPIILIRAPKTDFFEIKPAGLLIHTPPADFKEPAAADAPPRGKGSAEIKWTEITYFELVVDGEIVDLNRIQLPPDTPIIDKRFDKPSERPK